MSWHRNPNGTYSYHADTGRAVARVFKERHGWSWTREDAQCASGASKTLKAAKVAAEASLQ